MGHTSKLLHMGVAAVLVAVAATAVQAQSIDPTTVDRTLGVGESLTIHKSITLGEAGATTVDLFFLADNTGSMGGIISLAQAGAGAILGGLPDSYRFGVGRYVGDPSEGVAPAYAYAQNTALTFDKTAAQAGINAWFAIGGGDTPEANFFALKQVADGAGWRDDAQRLIVWFGDAPSHTETTTQAEAISALQDAGASVVAFNTWGSGSGIDQYGQASAIVSAPPTGAGGTLVNNFSGLTSDAFIDAVNSQISSAVSTIDLIFGSTLMGSGLTLDFACTDVLGCTDVPAGATRTFDLTLTGVTAGVYDFDVFARGIDAFESDHITVGPPTGVVPEPTTWLMLATGLVGLAFMWRRRRDGVNEA